MHHVAVSNAAAAARVVARHAAQGGLSAGRYIDWVPKRVFFKRSVEVVEHDARLYFCGALGCINVKDVAHIFGVVNHQACTHRLTALAGTATTRDDGNL